MTFEIIEPILVIGLGRVGADLAEKAKKSLNSDSLVISHDQKDLTGKNSIKISIEAGNIFGWEKYVGPDGISLGIKSFGKSAPYKKIYEHFNLTSDNVVKTAKKMLGK